MPGQEPLDDLAAWDAGAARYAESLAGPEVPVTPELRRFLHRALGDLSGLTVLDLGCGSGWLCAEVAELGGEVLGIDGSERLLAMARAAHAELSFVQADLRQGLPDLGGRRFDRVVAQMVLMHLGELDHLLADIGQCLRPNGCFASRSPIPHSPVGPWCRPPRRRRSPAIRRPAPMPAASGSIAT